MTTAADDSAVEEAFEAYLAGRRVPGAESGLVSFADAVRASATEPGRPTAALAGLLATGLLQDQPGPAARPARRPRRRRTRMLASSLFAKLLSAGLAAKAATAAGVAVVALSTAGFTGNLGPAQHTFATVVDYATPFTAPSGTTSADTTPTTTDPATDPTTTDQTGTVAATPSGTDAPASSTPFGQQVSKLAHDDKAAGTPGVDGQAVSSMARSRHSGDAEDAQDGQDSESSASDSPDRSGDTPDATPSARATTGHGDSAGEGHGHR